MRRRIIDGVFWLTAVKVIAQVISWTVTIHVIRILSPNDYGLMAMAGIYLGFIVLVNEMGLGTVIIQQTDLNRKNLSSIFWAVLLMNALLFTLSVVSAPSIALFFNEPRLANVIRVASFVLIVSSLGFVSYHMLTREMTFNKRSQADMIGNLCGAVSTLGLSINGFGVWSLVLGNIIIELTKNVLFFAFYPWKPELSFSFPQIKNMLHFGSKVVLARLFWYVSSNADFLIAGKLLGKTQLGYYAIAFQFASIPLDKMVSAISQVALPAFSEVQADHALLRRYFLKIARFLAFVSFPAFLGMCLVAQKGIPLFLSEKWLPAILPMQILCIVSAFRAIETMNAPLVIAIGRPHITMINNLITGVLLAASFFIGSSYGLEGLAYSWFTFPIIWLITTAMSLNQIGLSVVDYVVELRHPFFGTAAMAITVTILQQTFFANAGSLAHVVGSVIVGLMSYLSYYWLFNPQIFAEGKNILKR
jgi:O-antigen/teichoic acid export membrane protein